MVLDRAQQLVGAARQCPGADPVGDLGDRSEASGGDTGVVERGEVDLHPGDIDRTSQLVVDGPRLEQAPAPPAVGRVGESLDLDRTRQGPPVAPRARVIGRSNGGVPSIVEHPACECQPADNDPCLGDVERSRCVERCGLRQLPRLVWFPVAQRLRQQHAGDDGDLAVAGRSRQRQCPFARAARLLDVAADEEQPGEHRHRVGDQP